MLEEKDFKAKCDKVYNAIMDAFEEVDPDEAEAFFHLDNITITFKNGTRFIVNRQTPVRQIWLATKKQGLHFVFDDASKTWISDKTSKEFFQTLSEEISSEMGQNFNFSFSN